MERIANTYDWMTATADSRVNNKICVNNKILIINKEREDPVFPNNVISKWPAIILAESRIANVPGRITFLISSIYTINGISTPGVPWGIKWLNMCWVWFIHP